MTVKELISHLKTFADNAEVDGRFVLTYRNEEYLFAVQKAENESAEEQKVEQHKIGFVG